MDRRDGCGGRLGWLRRRCVVQVSPTLSERETATLVLFGAVFGVWVVVWLVLAWRFSGIGGYVSADGIQVRKWLKTTTISSSAVERIGAAPATRLTVPATDLAMRIFPYHGPKIETMLYRSATWSTSRPAGRASVLTPSPVDRIPPRPDLSPQ